jgi:four helix bundle protein
MADFKHLAVWKSSHELVLQIYRQTAALPRHELFGLTSQMRRAAVSIPANIAEGRGRDTDREFARFITMSLGSANELEYFLILAKDLGYQDSPQNAAHLASVGRRLHTLRASLQRP